ncbi:hypothetical protein [Oceaniglobus ichthyenteri]|uniref:hypothetical protein n=1 Tax=Oceaniglobus ichthyenteri TaxID=2136177 RepID=UPI0013DE7817|nr:hypothetical protein [Oceaniglobus ichthyenteri]
MKTGTFYELARARRAIALETLAMRANEMGMNQGRNRTRRLTKADAHRLMLRAS